MNTVTPKQPLLLLFICLMAFTAERLCCQTTYTWNQTGIANWNTAAHWTPDRNTPAADDILVFNNGAVTTAINISSQTIGRLVVTGNTFINLEGAANGTVITISGQPGADLQVDAGAALHVSGNVNTITLLVAAGANASISGDISFSGAPHRLDAADAGAVVFNSPAVCTQANGCTGSLFTAAGTSGTIVFSAGTTLVQEAGGNPFGLAAPASKVVFATGSLLKIKQNALIATQGRSYADVEIDLATFNQTLTGAAQPLSVNNLTITKGILNINLTGASTVNIKGDISVAAGQTLHFNPAAAGTVNFNGTVPQAVTSNGILLFGASQALTFNNSAGITFNSPVTFNNTVQFIAGIVTVPNPLKLTWSATAAATGASNASFTDGKVEKTGSTDFTFPIGKPGFGYVPLLLQNFTGGSATSAFVAEYKRQSANSLSVSLATGIHHVSDLDHWTLENTGSDVPAVDITLSWNAFTSNNGSVNFITLPGFLDLVAARYDPVVAAWSSYGGQGNTTSGSTVIAGGITWPGLLMLPAGTAAGFSLASTTVQNPLPVTVQYLSVRKQAASNILEWQLRCSGNGLFKIELQRAGAGKHFAAIDTTNTAGLPCLRPFYFTDTAPPAGINYYRVKLTGQQGVASYSTEAAVNNSGKGFTMELLQPGAVYSVIPLYITVAKTTTLYVQITDISGRLIKTMAFVAVSGGNRFYMDVSVLPPAVYFITASVGNGIAGTLRFIKQ